jgi:hypothetical protein
LEQERNLGVPYFSTCSTSHHHRIIKLIQTLDLVGLKTQAIHGICVAVRIAEATERAAPASRV